MSTPLNYANLATLPDSGAKKPRTHMAYGDAHEVDTEYGFHGMNRATLQNCTEVDEWKDAQPLWLADYGASKGGLPNQNPRIVITHWPLDQTKKDQLDLLSTLFITDNVTLPFTEAPTVGSVERSKRPLKWAAEVYIKYFQLTLQDSTIQTFELESAETTPKDNATNVRLGTKVRFDALLEWGLEDQLQASSYILRELPQAADSWRDGLVHAAMDTCFKSKADRDRLADLLLDVAIERRHDKDASAASVTRAAILRAGSILSSAEIDRLRPFLKESKSNLVALVAMLRIVSNDPPTEFSHEQLKLELRNIVSTHSDPLVYRRGDIDAALFNALELLAVYSPNSFADSLDDLARLEKPYLFEQLHEELVEIQNNWQASSDSEAGQNLALAIKKVHQQFN